MSFYGRDYPDVPDVDPHGEILEGAALLDQVEAFLTRFVAFPSEHARVAVALWVVHTHALTAFENTPRLALLSPEPGSGKTRALEILELLTLRPLLTVNVTPAYLFRKVADEAGPPTLLYDEIDTVFGPKAKDNEDIRGMLNAGYRRGATAGRCVVKGKSIEVEELPAFAACALAGLDDLPDTIMSRSIVIRMRRRAPHETVQPYRRRVHQSEGDRLRDNVAAWASAHWARLEDAWPDLPKGIEDRNADIWEPLLAIADAAGNHWPQRARRCAVALVADSQEERGGFGIQLLTDMRRIFGNEQVMPTEEVLEKLHALEESPWSDIRGKPLDARNLSRRLGRYGIKPKVLRVGDRTPRGYERAEMLDAWVRYLPPDGEEDGSQPLASYIPPPRMEEEGNGASEAAPPLFPQKSATSATDATGPVCKHCSEPISEMRALYYDTCANCSRGGAA